LGHIGNISKKNLGNFSIIEITHEVSQGSYYKNRFKAIPATIKALPSPKVRMPLAETQMATVLSNADPEDKGRVRVRMNWQTDGMQTSWVRVMTPDGGSSSDVKSNRGFVFIPEVGDQVLLGFRHGDSARPYVMGSLFNGTTGGGGLEGNHMKSLTTRSGHTIKLNDSLSSLGITIKDIINCKNANILAEESINMNAEQDITSVSGESTSIQAGESLTEIAADSYVLSANDANVQVTEEHNLQASTISETAEKINIDSTMEDLDLSSPKKVNIQSSEKVNLF